jgi:hypothetical protein
MPPRSASQRLFGLRCVLPPAGTIAGARNNGKGVAGVAPDARVVSAKFLGSRGGTTAGAIEAYGYLTALRNRGVMLGVINNSCESQSQKHTQGRRQTPLLARQPPCVAHGPTAARCSKQQPGHSENSQ